MPVLDYQPPQPCERRWPAAVRWVVPLLAGAAAGYLLSRSAYGWFCYGVVLGFAVGTLSAAFAPGRRLAFGLLGNGVTVVVAVAWAAIRDNRLGVPIRPEVMVGLLMGLYAVVAIPGLVGVLLVAAVDPVTRGVRPE